ncbi:MAG: hypothetical protein HFJ55_04035 [Clostridia bacterium]|nr:hypothetical protein [Clostridia bacterium]
MARISDMLLKPRKKNREQESNSEAARKAVESYKMLIDENTDLHHRYEEDVQIGNIEVDENGKATSLTFIALRSQKVEILNVNIEGGTVGVNHLSRFLEQEGLYVREVHQRPILNSFEIRIR